MSDPASGTPNLDQSRKAFLSIALDHAWRWYDFRYGQAGQVLNFFTLAGTVLAAAYVSAINAGHHGLATALALLASLLTAATYVVGTRLTGIANLALESVREIQAELADDLGIDSLRLVERRANSFSVLSGSRAIATILFPIIIVVCLAAAGFAWFSR
jgi:hypothetical protein